MTALPPRVTDPGDAERALWSGVRVHPIDDTQLLELDHNDALPRSSMDLDALMRQV
jgi:hypothetical protein